jgi:flagella synthesis protein FlgN
MEAWLATPAGTAGRESWTKLLILATEARELNQINGQLIALHMQNNQQALAVLMAAANQAMTYGPDGQQRGSGSGRSLGSA